MNPERHRPDESGLSALADLFANLSIFFLVASIGAFIALSSAGSVEQPSEAAAAGRDTVHGITGCDQGRAAFDGLITYATRKEDISVSHEECSTTFAFQDLTYDLGDTAIYDSWRDDLTSFCGYVATDLLDVESHELTGYRLQFTGHADHTNGRYDRVKSCLDRPRNMAAGRGAQGAQRTSLRDCLLETAGDSEHIHHCQASVANSLSPEFLGEVHSLLASQTESGAADRDRFACYISNLVNECHALERARAFYHFCSTTERLGGRDGVTLWRIARRWQQVGNYTSASTSPHPTLTGPDTGGGSADDSCLMLEDRRGDLEGVSIRNQRGVTFRIDYPFSAMPAAETQAAEADVELGEAPQGGDQ